MTPPTPFLILRMRTVKINIISPVFVQMGRGVCGSPRCHVQGRSHDTGRAAVCGREATETTRRPRPAGTSSTCVSTAYTRFKGQ